jgi:hypothetical protein
MSDDLWTLPRRFDLEKSALRNRFRRPSSTPPSAASQRSAERKLVLVTRDPHMRQSRQSADSKRQLSITLSKNRNESSFAPEKSMSDQETPRKTTRFVASVMRPFGEATSCPTEGVGAATLRRSMRPPTRGTPTSSRGFPAMRRFQISALVAASILGRLPASHGTIALRSPTHARATWWRARVTAT